MFTKIVRRDVLETRSRIRNPHIGALGPSVAKKKEPADFAARAAVGLLYYCMS